jgi:hypothetical protein
MDSKLWHMMFESCVTIFTWNITIPNIWILLHFNHEISMIGHILGYNLLCYKEYIYIPQSLRQKIKNTVLVLWIFTSSKADKKKDYQNTMTWHGLKKDFERVCLSCQICQITKMKRKNSGPLPPKIAETDTQSLAHSMCGSCGSIYNKDTSQNTLYSWNQNNRSSLRLVWNCQSDKLVINIHPGFSYNIWLARYSQPQFIVFVNVSMGAFKREPITSHNQHNTSKCNHWASKRSCVLSMKCSDNLTWKSNHENL